MRDERVPRADARNICEMGLGGTAAEQAMTDLDDGDEADEGARRDETKGIARARTRRRWYAAPWVGDGLGLGLCTPRRYQACSKDVDGHSRPIEHQGDIYEHRDDDGSDMSHLQHSATQRRKHTTAWSSNGRRIYHPITTQPRSKRNGSAQPINHNHQTPHHMLKSPISHLTPSSYSSAPKSASAPQNQSHSPRYSPDSAHPRP